MLVVFHHLAVRLSGGCTSGLDGDLLALHAGLGWKWVTRGRCGLKRRVRGGLFGVGEVQLETGADGTFGHYE